MAIREAVVRDHFAARFPTARTEVRLEFGRCDVVTDRFAFEVEPVRSWKHGVRQAMAYAQESGKRPGIAVYGAMTPTEAVNIWHRCGDKVELYMLDGTRWQRVTTKEQANRPWEAPPEDIVPARRSRHLSPAINRVLNDVALYLGMTKTGLLAVPGIEESIARLQRIEAGEETP